MIFYYFLAGAHEFAQTTHSAGVFLNKCNLYEKINEILEEDSLTKLRGGKRGAYRRMGTESVLVVDSGWRESKEGKKKKKKMKGFLLLYHDTASEVVWGTRKLQT